MTDSGTRSPTGRTDAIVVGAGFAGMYMLYQLRQLGLTARVFEAGSDVGGTWYWNRYPGARCDVESIEYSYSFSPELEQEWTWSERYPTQAEVLRYAQHVADRFDLRRDITFDTTVSDMRYDETSHGWQVTTDRGERFESRFVILATGALSVPKDPELDGVERFAGTVNHTARWPAEGVDFTGKRVGVVGTGSSGIQAIPEIAQQAEHLYVFQRTANFSVPARNAPLSEEQVAAVKASYAEIRHRARTSPGGHALMYGETPALTVEEEERLRTYEKYWEIGGPGLLLVYSDLRVDERANTTLAEFVRSKIRSLVNDPETADKLTPKDHPIGAKRICVDSGYFETFNRPNVTLVDVRAEPIVEVEPNGVRTTERTIELDDLVFASGFDAMTGALMRINPRGKGGRELAEVWSDGPHSYLGITIAGFPNLFTITGPGSPSVLSNVIVSIEQHVDWITNLLRHMLGQESTTVEADPEAESAWMAHVHEVSQRTLFPKASSWYMGDNVPGKPRVFMPYAGGVGNYRARCDEIAAAGYPGLTFSAE